MLNYKTAIKIVLIALFFSGCASQPDVPHVVIPEGSEKVSVAYLKSIYERTPVAVDREIYIQARVVSSDNHGNFYKTMVVEDETGGIAVRIDLENYYRKYDKGSLVKINCNSLVLSDYGGVIQLSAYVYDQTAQYIGYIPANRLDAIISLDRKNDKEVVPAEAAIAALTPNHISRAVRFSRVQFVDEELGLEWTEDGADTDRHIVDGNGNRLIVRTSAHAVFATRLLPAGSGSIQGVLGYFNGEYQLILCNMTSVIMKDARF